MQAKEWTAPSLWRFWCSSALQRRRREVASHLVPPRGRVRVLGDGQGRDLVERLLQEQKQYVRVLLAENRHLVAALRDALIERHELVGHQITDVLAAADAAAGSVRPAAGERTIDLREGALVSAFADDTAADRLF